MGGDFKCAIKFMYMYYNSAITETEQGRSLEYEHLWV